MESGKPGTKFDPKTKSSGATQSTRPVVLLLDDEPIIRQSLSRYLDSAGFEVHQSSDVDEAISVLNRRNVDALILDVRLPNNRSGLEVLVFARTDERWKDLPIVVLTGDAFSLDEEEIVRRHPAYVFYKPQGYRDLVERLNRLVRRPQGFGPASA